MSVLTHLALSGEPCAHTEAGVTTGRAPAWWHSLGMRLSRGLTAAAAAPTPLEKPWLSGIQLQAGTGSISMVLSVEIKASFGALWDQDFGSSLARDWIVCIQTFREQHLLQCFCASSKVINSFGTLSSIPHFLIHDIKTFLIYRPKSLIALEYCDNSSL